MKVKHLYAIAVSMIILMANVTITLATDENLKNLSEESVTATENFRNNDADEELLSTMEAEQSLVEKSMAGDADDLVQTENSNQEVFEHISDEDVSLTYDEYFSVDRPFNEEISTYNDNGFDYTFDYHTRIVQLKDNVNGETTNPFKKKVEKSWRFGNYLYAYTDSDVIKYSMDSKDSTVLFTENIASVSDLAPFGQVDKLDDFPYIHLIPELAFYVSGKSIYRYYIPTQTKELVYNDPDLVSFDPISNNEIFIAKLNPEWKAEVSRNGNLDTGISELVCYTYNIQEKTEIPYEISFDPDKENFESETSISPFANYGGYGPGSYFTTTGKSDANTCHAKGYCAYPKPANCQCKEYRGAIQCMGYAKYVYEQSIGGSWSQTQTHYMDMTTMGQDVLYARLDTLFKQIKSGTHVRLQGRHSVAFGAPTGGRVMTGYECNATDKQCLVTNARYTYDGLKRWKYLWTNE